MSNNRELISIPKNLYYNIDKYFKKIFKLSFDDLLKFKDILKENNILLSFVINNNNIIDLDIYIHKNKLNIFLDFLKMDMIDSFLTLEDELYFNKHKIIQQIIYKNNITILVVDNSYFLKNILDDFLFDIMIGYYNDKININKYDSIKIDIEYKYTKGLNKRQISFIEKKIDIYNDNGFDITITNVKILDKIVNDEKYIIKNILNNIFDIYINYFNLSNKLIFLNLFNKYTYNELIEKLQIILKYKIDIKRLIFNTIKYILFYYYKLQINQTIFKKILFTSEPKNIFLKFIIKYKLFDFDYFNYVNLIEYEFSKSIKEYIELSLNIKNNPKITNKKIDIEENVFDFMNQEYVNIKEYIKKDNNNIILILNNKNITVYTKETLDNLVSNKDDKWFFKCDNIDPKKILESPYIQISTIGGNIYVNYNDLYNLFVSKSQIFFLKKTEDITKSQSFKNTSVGQSIGIADYVSANHCQNGSILGIYEIYELGLNGKIKALSQSSKSSSKSIFFKSSRV